jgi:hypothetical protein
LNGLGDASPSVEIEEKVGRRESKRANEVCVVNRDIRMSVMMSHRGRVRGDDSESKDDGALATAGGMGTMWEKMDKGMDSPMVL